MKRDIFLIAVFAVWALASGCTKHSAPSDQAQTPADAPVAPLNESKPTDASPVAATAGTVTRKCSNGKAPEQTKGVCKGSWKLRTTNGETFCDFDWGPKVSCPAGQQPLGTPNFCYGTTTKPAGPKIKSAADCLAEYTDAPITPNYTLECCS